MRVGTRKAFACSWPINKITLLGCRLWFMVITISNWYRVFFPLRFSTWCRKNNKERVRSENDLDFGNHRYQTQVFMLKSPTPARSLTQLDTSDFRPWSWSLKQFGSILSQKTGLDTKNKEKLGAVCGLRFAVYDLGMIMVIVYGSLVHSRGSGVGGRGRGSSSTGTT